MESILSEVEAFPTRLICVTGGEPLAQEEVHSLLTQLRKRGFEVLLETSGALDASKVDPGVVRILDLKAPGSGESTRNLGANFETLRATDEVKIVVADRADYEWARQQIEDRQLVDSCACVLLSPVHGELAPTQLAAWILEDGLAVTLQRQEHKLLWPDAERGV